MAGGVFLIQGDGSLVAMTEEAYPSEDTLQVLLAKYPDLLAGDQVDPEKPRRWLLISRESPIPSEEGGSWQFSVDHLFLDQDAVPTLVEVKRASDTRTRREVVAQMLDYAANANAYGPVKPLREQFEERCKEDGIDPDEEVASRLGADIDPQDLWERASTNLSAGKLRLVFVADDIPLELRRIVEYLNTQMSETQVIALEVKQFVGEGLKVMVPKVIGMTEEARGRKGGARPSRDWDEASFFEAFASSAPELVGLVRRIYDWAADCMSLRWGRGATQGSMSVGVTHQGVWYPAVVIWTTGQFNFPFDVLSTKPPFDRDEKRLELLERLNEIPLVDLDDSTLTKSPTRALQLLAEDAAAEKLFSALEWFARTVREQQ